MIIYPSPATRDNLSPYGRGRPEGIGEWALLEVKKCYFS
jgi:hypothetical protein